MTKRKDKGLLSALELVAQIDGSKPQVLLFRAPADTPETDRIAMMTALRDALNLGGSQRVVLALMPNEWTAETIPLGMLEEMVRETRLAATSTEVRN